MIWRRGLFWQVVLLAANLLLLAGIILVWWGDDTPAPSRTGQGPEVPRAPLLRDSQPLNAFRVVSVKNLFSPDRSGPDLGGATAKVQDTLEGRRLLGIIIIGEEKAALIGSPPGPTGPLGGRTPRPAMTPEIQVVRLGEEWGGYKVLDITSEGVVLQGKEGKKTLNFPE